jgi:hypothetical protein
MRWRSKAGLPHAPIELDPIRLSASRFGWLAGLLWLVLAVGLVVGLILGVMHALTAETGEIWLMLTGAALASPGVFLLAWIMLIAGTHLLRPRRGTIVLNETNLAIHDQWMLHRLLVIERYDILEIRRVPQLSSLEYSGFARDAGWELATSGLMLDWGSRPNYRIVLRRPRQFVEAIRTLPSRAPLRPISKYLSHDGLLIRVADPDEAAKTFDHWLRHTEAVGRSHSPATRVSDPLHFGWMMMLTFIGFVCFCIGAVL